VENKSRRKTEKNARHGNQN
jgi:hypothetical protein